MDRKKTRFLVGAIVFVIVMGLMGVGFLVRYLEHRNDYMDQLNAIQEGDALWAHGANTLEELVGRSDLIVQGRVIDYWAEDEGGLVFTAETVKVQKVMKGDVAVGDHITVYFTGGNLDGWVNRPLEDCPIMDMRGPYMLFLVALEGLPEGNYAIFSGNLGYGKIKDDRVDYLRTDELTDRLKELTLEELSQEIRKFLNEKSDVPLK
ncbi:MAG: hypothetical protein H7X94_15375 [Vallitaleaceae bacterium]|nr:hypothetical protein [Vallitaleaceae bacterium]